MNSTLKPHLLVEVMGLQNRPLPPKTLYLLFLAYRRFPEAFQMAFRYRCHVRYRCAECFSYYISKIVVRTKGGILFIFDSHFCVPILLRIAGRFVHSLDDFSTTEAWAEPFLEAIDQNQNLEFICARVNTFFLKRYLQHHNEIPAIEIGYHSFTILDELGNPKVDTLILRSNYAEGSNTKPCCITNIVIGSEIRSNCNPLKATRSTLMLDMNSLKSLDFKGETIPSNVHRMVKNGYPNVLEIKFHRVRLPVVSTVKTIQEAVNYLKNGVEALWDTIIGHSGAVEVGAYFDRFIPSTRNSAVAALQSSFDGCEITHDTHAVDCLFQKKEGNKVLVVSISIGCWR